MFEPILDPNSTYYVAMIFACIGVALVCGAIVSLSYRINNPRYSKNMLISLALLPLFVFAIVLLVNRADGSTIFGTGVAIAGAFALVRFRTIPGNSRDILCVMFTMATGIAVGVGMIWFALILAGIGSVLFIILNFIPFDKMKNKSERELRITIPEDLDFAVELAPILKNYTKAADLIRIKTSKMGSLFEVRYKVVLKEANAEKKFIDDLRVKNGNLPIVLRKPIETGIEEL